MHEWASPLVVFCVAGLGTAVTWGMLRSTVKAQGDWLAKLAESNMAEHRRLHERIDDERDARSEGYKEVADSVTEHFVRKDYCALMHDKKPPNGSAHRERA